MERQEIAHELPEVVEPKDSDVGESSVLDVVGVEVLREQRDQLIASVALREERADMLERVAEHERKQARRDAAMAERLSRFLGEPGSTDPDNLIRGTKLVSVALDILAEQQIGDKAIHYTAWYQLVRNAGYTIGGDDPVATFLSNLVRSKKVESAGYRTGYYRPKQQEES